MTDPEAPFPDRPPRFGGQVHSLAGRFGPWPTLGLVLAASLATLAAAGWALGTVVQNVLATETHRALDGPVLRLFVRHREPALTTAAKAVTALGSSAVIIPVLLVAGLVWRAWRGSWRPLAVLGLAYLGAEALFQLTKALVGRPRPPAAQAVAQFSGSAFPSGHATLAVAAWGALAALVAASAGRGTGKVAPWAAAAAVAAVIGLTRLYLGAHWLTDVIGGWAFGGLWLLALLSTVRALAPFDRTSG